jgi:hypothetical protein
VRACGALHGTERCFFEGSRRAGWAWAGVVQRHGCWALENPQRLSVQPGEGMLIADEDPS